MLQTQCYIDWPTQQGPLPPSEEEIRRIKDMACPHIRPWPFCSKEDPPARFPNGASTTPMSMAGVCEGNGYGPGNPLQYQNVKQYKPEGSNGRPPAPTPEKMKSHNVASNLPISTQGMCAGIGYGAGSPSKYPHMSTYRPEDMACSNLRPSPFSMDVNQPSPPTQEEKSAVLASSMPALETAMGLSYRHSKLSSMAAPKTPKGARRHALSIDSCTELKTGAENVKMVSPVAAPMPASKTNMGPGMNNFQGFCGGPPTRSEYIQKYPNGPESMASPDVRPSTFAANYNQQAPSPEKGKSSTLASCAPGTGTGLSKFSSMAAPKDSRRTALSIDSCHGMKTGVETVKPEKASVASVMYGSHRQKAPSMKEKAPSFLCGGPISRDEYLKRYPNSPENLACPNVRPSPFDADMIQPAPTLKKDKSCIMPSYMPLPETTMRSSYGYSRDSSMAGTMAAGKGSRPNVLSIDNCNGLKPGAETINWPNYAGIPARPASMPVIPETGAAMGDPNCQGFQIGGNTGNQPRAYNGMSYRPDAKACLNYNDFIRPRCLPNSYVPAPARGSIPSMAPPKGSWQRNALSLPSDDVCPDTFVNWPVAKGRF